MHYVKSSATDIELNMLVWFPLGITAWDVVDIVWIASKKI